MLALKFHVNKLLTVVGALKPANIPLMVEPQLHLYASGAIADSLELAAR